MKINVSPEELRARAAKLEGMANDYKSLYQNQLLNSNLGELENAWYGEDQQTYSEKVRGFEANFVAMYNLMMEYAAHLKKAATENYDRAQDELVAAAKNL